MTNSWLVRNFRVVIGVLVLGGTLSLAAAPVGASSSTQRGLTQAKRHLLVRTDFPKGWVSKPESNNGPTVPGSAELAACLGVPLGVINSNPPTANSPEFESGNKWFTVEDSVSKFSSVKAAEANYSSAASSKTPACLTTVLNGAAKSTLAGELGAGATIGTVQVVKAPASEFAPCGAGFTAYLPVTEMEATINVQLTVVVYVKGVENQTLTLISLEQPFPTALAHRLTMVAADRL